MTAYYPTATYPVHAHDVEYRQDGASAWLAHIYQPEGGGPFPMVLDVHGGAWNIGYHPGAAAHVHQDLAASGLVVAAIDFRLAPQHPYPAQVQDVHYATRWLKAHAADLNGDATLVGGLGFSSGGHTILLSAMRPHDHRYGALPLAGAPKVDARLAYIVAWWPVLDPYARYQFAQRDPAAGTGFGGPDPLVRRTEAYFLTEATMQEANPQLILDRGEPAETPPLLIIHGTNDLSVPSYIVERFVASYRSAGGAVEVEWFQGQPHGFAYKPGPETDRAVALAKAFIARQLAARVAA